MNHKLARTAVILLFKLIQLKASVRYFWHVSDFHLDPRYGSNISDGRSLRDIFLGDYDEGCWTESRNPFGDYNCDSPLALVQSATQFMKNVTEANSDIDFIVWTGDDLSHAPEEVFTREETLDTVRTVTSELARVGLPVIPSLGNHDIIPKNQYPTHANVGEEVWRDYYEEIAAIWREELPLTDEDILGQFELNGGFYEHQVTPNLTLISLNTNLWYKSNLYTSDMADPGEMLAWLDSVLASVEERNATAWIIGHIPPGKFERFYQKCGEYKGCDTHGGYYGFHWLTEDFNQKYISIIQKFNTPHINASDCDVMDHECWDDAWDDFWDHRNNYMPPISAQLFAHHHTDSVKMFYSDEFLIRPISAAFLVPGVSPMRSTLATETGANNPGLRLYKYNVESGEILDYDQYFLNLTDVIHGGLEHWQKSYSMLEYYGLESLSFSNLSHHIYQLKDNRTYFDRYYLANTVMLEEASEDNCNSTCQGYHFCAGLYQDYEDFEECVKPYHKLNHDYGEDIANFFESVLGIIVAVLMAIVLMVIVMVVLCCCGCISCVSFSRVFNKR